MMRTIKLFQLGLVDSHIHLRGLSNNFLGVGAWACFPFGVTSAVDLGRKSGVGKIRKKVCSKAVITTLSQMPKGAIKTITCDRGSEFAN